MGLEWIVQLPILFFSVIVHELSHGYLALFRGDDTAAKAGRLTLNPIPHLDPFGTLVLPVFCLLSHLPMLAWAKPVPIHPARFARPRLDLIAVALAGPCSNLALALAGALLFKTAALLPALEPSFQRNLLNACVFAVSINLFLAFFNLIPIHPLDGSKVLGGLLPAPWRAAYDRHAPYGMFLIVFLMASKLLAPMVLVPSQAALALLSGAGLIW